MKKTNRVKVAGRVVSAPEIYTCCGERFWAFDLEIQRLSGSVDVIPINCPMLLLEKISEGDQLCLSGQVRSYAKTLKGKSKLRMSVFVMEVLQYSTDENEVSLEGRLCSKPEYKQTPSGRRLCYSMLAVVRDRSLSDYIPQLFWGRAAERVKSMEAGTNLSVKGRLQSRTYIKGDLRRTVYEVSVSQLEEDE